MIGADPAEGNPQSDESAAVVIDTDTNEQVAVLGVRCDPELFATHLRNLARLYGEARILVERNNHGHAVLLALRSSGSVLQGPDREPGWLTTGASKAQAFAHVVGALRDRALVIHDEITVLAARVDRRRDDACAAGPARRPGHGLHPGAGCGGVLRRPPVRAGRHHPAHAGLRAQSGRMVSAHLCSFPWIDMGRCSKRRGIR